jgi:hypothetical protein
MSEQNTGSSKVMFLVGGIAIFVILAAAFIFMLQENPQQVVYDFFQTRGFDKRLMYVTPESAVSLSERIERFALQSGISVDRAKQMLDQNSITLRSMDNPVKIDDANFMVNVTLVFTNAEGEETEETGPVYLKKLGGSWKIDVTQAGSVAIF